MNRFEGNIRQTAQATTKYAEQARIQFWENKTCRLTILFVIAVLFISGFTYHQYRRRHFALSASTQRQYNRDLKAEIDNVNALQRKLQFLEKLIDNPQVDSELIKQVREVGIPQIEHQAELLSNCTKQYIFDQQQVKDCEEIFSDELKRIETTNAS